VKVRATAFVLGAVSLVVIATGLAALADDRNDDAHEWDEMVDEARAHMEAQLFNGVIKISWRDGATVHRAEIEVRHTDGVLEVVAGKRVLADDTDRMLADGEAWSTLAHARDGANMQLAPGKYRVMHSPGPAVAGHRTTRYEASRDGVPVERVYVADESGLVLRRETLNGNGEILRSVSFTRVELISPRSGAAETPSTLPARSGPEAVGPMDAPYRDPDSAGDGFRLLGRWERVKGVVQLYYSDGLLAVSVFEQPGRLDWDALPSGADIDVAGNRGRRYALPVGEAWVFERGGVVYTFIGDAPPDEIRAVAQDVSAPDQSRLERLADTVVAPYGW
jgi:hypothetical protein